MTIRRRLRTRSSPGKGSSACSSSCLGLWLVAIGGLIAAYGWDAVLTQMAWFFTKAALLTFGGAYAVLPYVYQGAVENYQWLTPVQMIDGLALGETTPGPLIMVVSFVGFVGGWTKAIFGADSLFLSGAAAATVVTFFTFLPSFFFILLGAPFIESTHGNLKFTAPLTAITAAVVGVIVNLAVFFAYHVLWPQGLGRSIRMAFGGHRPARGNRALPLQGRRHSRHRRLRRWPGSPGIFSTDGPGKAPANVGNDVQRGDQDAIPAMADLLHGSMDSSRFGAIRRGTNART